MSTTGVTLLELLAVMTIGAILALTALFGFRDLRREWELSGAVRQVVLDLRLARLAAISQARSRGLRFEADSPSYRRELQTQAGTYADEGAPRRLPAGVRVIECSGRGGSLRFRPRGNASSFGTVTLRGQSNATRRIVVDMAGRVRVAR